MQQSKLGNIVVCSIVGTVLIALFSWLFILIRRDCKRPESPKGIEEA